MIVIDADPLVAADFEQVARYFVDAGKVVPGLSTDGDGAGRSWWWPLPAAGDRELIASLVDPAAGPDGHAAAAAALAAEVDRQVRQLLVGLRLAPRRSGRRTVPQAWLASLTNADPYLPAGLDAERVAAFAEAVDEWVASGAVATGPARLCLRLCEPYADDESWVVELLVQDVEEPSLMVPLADLWAGQAPFGTGAVESILTGLGRLARIAPELAAVLQEAAPTEVPLPAAAVIPFALERIDALDDADIGVHLPAWWARRGRLSLRAKAKSSSASTPGVVTESGFGLQQLVSFSWEAALGERRITKAELQALLRAAAAKQGLVRVRGEWVQVDPDELRAILERVGTKGVARADELLRAGMGIDSLGLPDGVEMSGVRATGWLAKLLDEALHSTVQPLPTPPGFEGVLRPYQERGAGWMAFLGQLGLGACLADDMGLGKTAQLIATVLADPAGAPTLVVCPVSVLGNWERELQRFAPTLRVMTHHGAARHGGDAPFAERVVAHDVVLTTYSLLARDAEVLEQAVWGRVVFDEAQQIKNPSTAVAKAAARLRAGRRLALTGTPVENRLAELWAIMHVLNPGLLGSLRSFTTRFAGPIERDQDDEATELLRKVTTPFVLRRLKSDRTVIDDLPDKIEQTERCALTKEQASLYQAVVDEVLEAAAGADGITRSGIVLAGITKLKQVCNHPAHFLGDGTRLPGRSGKLTRVEELLDEALAAGDKVLCFTQYTEWGDMLQTHLARRYGRSPLWLHGGVRRGARDEMVAAFGSDDGPPIFLLSLKAGGTGLNLTAASHVVHLDRWWNPAVEDQATDRAYRIGQRRAVLVHKLVTAGTIEERIDDMIAGKRALAQRVVGAGEQWITELSTDELRDVIQLRGAEVEG